MSKTDTLSSVRFYVVENFCHCYASDRVTGIAIRNTLLENRFQAMLCLDRETVLVLVDNRTELSARSISIRHFLLISLLELHPPMFVEVHLC